MGGSLDKIRNQFNEYFQSLDKKQKIKIGIGSIFLLLTISLGIFYITKPNYVPMYSSLTLAEAGQITTKLDEMNIEWKDDNGGTTILVAKEDLNKARMNLAIEGFPKQGFTWDDALNSSSFTMTNEDRKMRYLRAEINSLARTIEEINGVESARVHLTVPDKENFLNENNEFSKASVKLALKPGFKLSPQQVNGIVMLVANAVEGLDPDKISVHDDTGMVLNNKSEDKNSYTLDNQMDMQQEIKSRLQKNIKDLLARIYGSSNVDVIVNVDLDFDREVTDIVEFSPPIDGETNGLVRSIAELKEQVKDGEQGGPPGTDSNSEAITQYNELENSDSKYNKEDRTVNYELNELRKNIIKAPGQIENITVAVVLNKKSLVNSELSDEHKSELTNLISAAAGLETKVVEVMAQDFNNSSEEDLVGISSEDEKGIINQLPIISIGIISLLFIIGAIFIFYRVRKRKKEINDILEVQQDSYTDPVDEIGMDVSDKSSYKYQVEKFVDKKPESVAQLLKTWLNDD